MNPGRLPAFVVVGATKGGTTSLFRYLSSHPGVWMPTGKELHFFDKSDHRDEGWYSEQFAAAEPHQLPGEMTPSYLDNPHAPKRMAATIPEAKLVAILRHPVDRAYSHYQMQEAKFPDKREFADVIQLEMDGGTPAVPPPHHSYLRVGRYHENLQRFLDYFPRSALLVMLMEDLAQDPAGTYRQLCRHIGVEATELPTNLGTAFNATKPVRSKAVRRFMLRSRAFKRLPRDWGLWLDRLNRVKSGYPPLDPVMRQRLLDYYADDTKALAELLDRDLSAWLR